MIFLRSLLFNIFFFGWSFFAAVLFLPLFIISPRMAQRAGAPWAGVTLWLARILCGITHEIRGSEYLQDAPIIYASKHQSAWDTIVFLLLFKRPAYVLKRELLRIPGWGWYLWRMKMIAIDRMAKASGMKQMLKQSKGALADRRPVIIFPEGTRTLPGAKSTFHPGVVAMYSMLKTPITPIALNSGCYWSKNAFMKYPGKIILEVLPPIAPSLEKDAFMATLQNAIEMASQKLLDEARQTTRR